MSVKIDGTCQSTDPTYNSVTVFDTYYVSNKYSLPTGSAMSGDVILSNGSQSLVFGPAPSAPGLVTSNAVSAVTGDVVIFDANSPTQINNSGVQYTALMQNPATAALNMNNRAINNSGNIDVRTGSANIRIIDTVVGGNDAHLTLEQTGGTGWQIGTDNVSGDIVIKTLAGTTVFDAASTGQVTIPQSLTLNAGSNSYSMPPTRGAAGQVIQSLGGAGTTQWAFDKISFGITMGANCTISAGFFVISATPATAVQAAATPLCTMTIGYASTLNTISYWTQTGDTTTAFAIYKNGSSAYAFTLPASTKGVITGVALSFSQGDTLSINYPHTGTNAGNTSFTLYFSET
jgi:hypothetical protein